MDRGAVSAEFQRRAFIGIWMDDRGKDRHDGGCIKVGKIQGPSFSLPKHANKVDRKTSRVAWFFTLKSSSVSRND